MTAVHARLVMGLVLAVFAVPLVAPVHAAQGGELAFVSNDNRGIHLVQADGSGDRQLVSVQGTVRSMTWAPDGMRLAYTVSTDTGATATQRIYQYDVATGHTSEVRSSVPTFGPIAFFPDGQRLAAVSQSTGGFPMCDSTFLTLDLASGTAERFGRAGCIVRLQVAPDGEWLLASRCTGAPECHVATVALPSGAENHITEASNVTPFSNSGAIAPDNQTLAYVAHHSFDPGADNADIVLTDRDGSNPRVVWQRGLIGTIAFAPDGSQLAATVSTSATSAQSEDIWLIGIDSANPHKIVSGHQPAWRPGDARPIAAPTSPVAPAANTWRNALYRSLTDGLGAGRSVQLVDGAYKAPAGSDGLEVSWTGIEASGDLDADGTSDTATILVESTSFNNIRVVLAAFVSQQGQVSHAASVVVGNRATAMKSLAIQSGQITLTGLGLGPNDPVCCPTKPFERVFALQGDQLLELAQADAPGPSMTPAPDGTAAAPDMLTDAVRSDILAAVDRANSAWVASGQSLDDAALDGAVAGQLLSDDLAEVNRLRGQGQTRTSINTAFAVTDVTLDAPGHAVVRTHETWYAETSERATGRLVQRTPSATYDETYIVEYQDGRWIVTHNDL